MGDPSFEELSNFVHESEPRDEVWVKMDGDMLRKGRSEKRRNELASALTERIQLDSRGSYYRRRELGRGGMGAVFEVWDANMERPLAMKMLLQKKGGDVDAGQVARFLKEAQITGQIDHPGVVPVHDIARDSKGRVYFTMQVVAGKSLKEILQLSPEVREKGGWTTMRLLDVILKVSETLAYAHSKGFIHRDLKPANIMVGRFGEAYVMDWGLATKVSPDEDGNLQAEDPDYFVPPDGDEFMDNSGVPVGSLDLTHDGVVLGTPTYMSPQQASGETMGMGYHGDVYAVGAMLYEILAGHPPYQDTGSLKPRQVLDAVRERPPTSLEERAPKTPPELIAITEKAMARDTDVRYQSMAVVGDDVRAYLENRVVKAHRTGALAELRKWIHRNQGFAAAVTVALMFAIVGLIIVSQLQSKRNDELNFYNSGINSAKIRTDRALAKERLAHRHARSLVLAGNSARALPDDPGSALLLALEADKLSENPSANGALLAALKNSREIRTFESKAIRSSQVAIDRNWNFLATRDDDQVVQVFDLRTGKRLSLMTGHRGRIQSLAFDASGSTLLTTGFDGTVAFWEVSTGRFSGEVGGLNQGGRTVQVAPDNQTFVTLDHVGMARVWDYETQRPIIAFSGQDDNSVPTAAAYSPDGRKVVVGWQKGDLHLIDLEEGKNRHLGRLKECVRTVEFSPDGRSLLTLARTLGNSSKPQSSCQLWDLQSFKERTVFPTHDVTVATFSGDGRKVALGCGKDGVVQLFDTETGSLNDVRRAGDVVSAISANQDGSLVAIGEQSGAVEVRSTTTNEVLFVLRGHAGELLRMDFSAQGDRLLTASKDGTVRLWRIREGSALTEWSGLSSLHEPQLGSDGRVLTIDRDGDRLSLRDCAQGSLIFEAEVGFPIKWRGYSAASEMLFAASESGNVLLWNIATGERRELQVPGEELTSARFTQNGASLMALSAGGTTLTRWDVQTAERTATETFPKPIGPSYSPDGSRVLVSISGKNRYELWDLDGKRRIKIIKALNARFSPNGERIAIWPHFHVEDDGLRWRGVTLIEGTSGKEIALIKGHRQVFDACAFDRSGQFLVTGSADQQARLWSASTGELITTLRGHKGMIGSCSVADGGRRVITICTDDHTTRLWNGRTGEQIAVLGQNSRRVRSAEFSREGNYITGIFVEDNGAAIWSAHDGSLQTFLPVSGGKRSVVKMSDDEAWALSWSIEGQALVWPVEVAEFAKKVIPRELRPFEREHHQVGNRKERNKASGIWTIRREIETLRLLEKSLGSDSTSVDKQRAEFRRSIATLTKAMLQVGGGKIVTAGEDQLLESLEVLGKDDVQAWHLVVTMQSKLFRNRSKATLERALQIPDLPKEIASEWRALLFKL